MSTLSSELSALAATVTALLDVKGAVLLDPRRADLLLGSIRHAAAAARMLEKRAGLEPSELNCRCIITYAQSGEPQPSAEVLDLSEILGREQVSRPASEAGPAAKVYAFPTVPRATFDFSGFDGGAA